MDFQVLGSLRACDGDAEVDLGGPKQRLVLAILLAAHGTTVTTDALIDGVWTGTPPATARKTLQGYVHHLRSRIPVGLETEKSGYSLTTRSHLVDERRFTSLVDEARPLVPHDPRAASEALSAALALWRGSPYADLDGAPVLLTEINRLNETRVVALGARIDADLLLGRHEVLVGELESLVVDYPFHERFREQHMLALYRSGRHGEALRFYARTRRQFVDELGIDPSDRLQDLEHRILDRDPSLDVDVRPAPIGSQAVRGYELRETVAGDRRGTVHRGYQRSVGREVSIRIIGPDLADEPEFIARFESDVARVAALDHPGIVYVHDSWRDPGHAYLVTRWIEGERLDATLDARRLGDESAMRILEQVAEALDVAHRAGVIHGDLDAHSVIRDRDDVAHLTDFAIGRPPGSVDDDRAAFVRLAFHVVFGVRIPIESDAHAALSSVVASPDLAVAFESAFADPAALASSDVVRSLRRAIGLEVVEWAPPGPLLAATGPSDLRCPYKGLHAFRVTDAGDFHGREDLVRRLTSAVRDRRLVAVVGPSGSGKSSLVKAGLLPRLHCAGHGLVTAEMYPGADPFESLTRAVRSVAVDDRFTSEDLISDPRGLDRVLDAVLPPDRSDLLLVIDQFEELFTAVHSEALRRHFLDVVTDAVCDPASRLRIVLTLRADFFDRPLRYADFGALVEVGLVPVAMPDRAGLVEAIERPAESVGLAIEPGLTGEIVRDVADEPGGLPLLQYALTDLFERREFDVLTLTEYRRTGGVLGALATRAEEVYSELDPAARSAMHHALLRMVAIDESGGHVRRRVGRAELHQLDVDTRRLDDALQRFGAHRLLTFDADPVSRAPTVEVAHESLLVEWARLRRWIADERDQLVVRRRLRAAVDEWHSAGEDDAYLLTGRRLAELDGWAGATEIALSADERAFLGASREHHDAQERSASTRRRRAAVALSAACVLALAFGAYAWVQRNEASHEAFRSETARLASEAGFVLEDDRQVALLMAAEAFRRDPGVDGLSALQRVLVGSGPYLGHLGAGNGYHTVRWVTDGDVLAATDDEVHLIDSTSGDVSVLPIDPGPTATGAAPSVVAVSPAGLAAIATSNDAVVLVDADDESVTPLPGGDAGTALDISADGSRLAIGRADGSVDLIDPSTGEVIATTVAHPARDVGELDLPARTSLAPSFGSELGGVDGVWFVPGGRLITAGDVFVRLWDAEDLRPLGPEIVHTVGDDDFNLAAAPARAAWSTADDPDGIVVVGDTHVSRWNGATGERDSLVPIPATIVGAVPGQGGQIYLLLDDGRLVGRPIDHDVASPTSVVTGAELVFDVQERVVTDVDVRPDGRTAVVATDDGAVLVALTGDTLLADALPIGLSNSPTVTADGTILAPGLATDALLDLTTDPPSDVAFDVDTEVANFGAPASFELLPAGDGDALLWTSEFAELRNAYDVRTGRYLGDFWGRFVPAWSDDGSRTAQALRGGGTRVDSSNPDVAPYEQARTMVAADFDGSGDRIVLVFDDGTGVVVDLASAAETELVRPPGGTATAAFTVDDTHLVTVGRDGAVWVVDPDDGRRIRSLDDAGRLVRGPAAPPQFSPDGTLMYAAADGVARLWHLPTGRHVGTFPVDPEGRPFAVAGHDALRVVTPVGADALLWNVDIARWAAIACTAAGRDLTAAEWSAFGPRDADPVPTCSQIRGGAP